MVKRLLEEQHLQGSDRELAELFRAAAPFEVNAFSKRRVLVNLERRQFRSVPRFWLRGVVVGALLISGSAAAAIGHRYIAPGSSLFGWFGSPATTAASLKVAPKAPASALMAALPAASAASEDSSAEPEPVAAEALAPSPAHASTKGRARPESSEDGKHVVEAIQALRTERDPSRAQALLNDYLKSHPHGVLSGDALALSIEAASAQHDPRAADYARRYLSAFPNGKYRDLANRALAGANAPAGSN